MSIFLFPSALSLIKKYCNQTSNSSLKILSEKKGSERKEGIGREIDAEASGDCSLVYIYHPLKSTLLGQINIADAFVKVSNL